MVAMFHNRQAVKKTNRLPASHYQVVNFNLDHINVVLAAQEVLVMTPSVCSSTSNWIRNLHLKSGHILRT